MKLSVSSMIFDHDDILKYLPMLSEEGVFYIELRGYPSRLDYRDKPYLRQLKDAMEKYGIKMTSWHLPFHSEEGLDISLPDKKMSDYALEEIKYSLDAMQFIGNGVAVIHPGDDIKNPEEKEERYKHSKENLSKILKICEKNKMKLAVENMLPGKVGATIDDVLNLISGFDSGYLGICFDTSHCNVTTGNVLADVKKCGSKLFNVHMSDNNGKKDEHALPFDGNIDWFELVKVLQNLNYHGVFTFEVRPKISEPRQRLQEVKRRFERMISERKT